MADPTFDQALVGKMIQKAKQGKEIGFAFGLGSNFEQSAFVCDPTKAGNVLAPRLKSAHPKLSKICFGSFAVSGNDITLFPNRPLTGMLTHLERKFRKAGLGKYKLALGQTETETEADVPPLPETATAAEKWQRARTKITDVLRGLPMPTMEHSPVRPVWVRTLTLAERGEFDAALAMVPQVQAQIDAHNELVEDHRQNHRQSVSEDVETLKTIPKKYWDADLSDRLKHFAQTVSPATFYDDTKAAQASLAVTRGLMSTQARHAYATALKEQLELLAPVDRAFWPVTLRQELARAKQWVEDINTPFEHHIDPLKQTVERAIEGEKIFARINTHKFREATCACTMGSAPFSLSALVSVPDETVEGFQSVQAAVAQPGSSFGTCQSPTNPAIISATAAAGGVFAPVACTVALTGDWQHGAASAVCQCAFGGEVSVTGDLRLPEKQDAWRRA